MTSDPASRRAMLAWRNAAMTGLARPAAAFLLAASLTGPGFASETRAMGPTAIAHVRISVSVAPRYRLSVAPVAMTAERSGGSGPVRYCLASNGRAPALPVALMWQPAGQEMGGVKPAELRVSGLANCTKEDGGFRGLNAPPTGLVILRPE